MSIKEVVVAQYRVVEICAGAGGQSLGLEIAGFEHELAVELDQNACATLRHNRWAGWQVGDRAAVIWGAPRDAPATDWKSRLRATRAVYLADGSIFPWIPPKGLTFNLMANADRVGSLLAERLA